MGLILRRVLYSIDASLEGASRVFIWVPKRTLSQPYELPMYSILQAKILEVALRERGLSAEEKKIFDELIGKPIDFILVLRKTGTDDALFISSSTWPTLRDYGVLPEQFEIELKIEKARFDDKILSIYQKRDVEID